MINLEDLAAWTCLGIAAAIVGGIWPFRRGIAGIAVNALIAVFGAVATAFVFTSMGIPRSAHEPIVLAVAVGGAAIAMGLAHAIWNRIVPRAGATVKSPEDVTEGLAPTPTRGSASRYRRST